MANEKSIRLAWRGVRRPLLLALLVLCGIAVCLASRHYLVKATLSEQANELISALADSVSAANRSANPIRVGLFEAGLDDGVATEDLRRFLDGDPIFKWNSVSPADIQVGGLEEYDIVIFPGGSAPRQAATLGENGKRAVRAFIENGGGYVGICGGAFLASAKYDSGMALVNAQPLTGKIDVPDVGIVSIAARGAGIVKMELTEAGKRVFGDSLGLVDIRYSGGPILSPANARDLPGFVSLAVFRTEVWEYPPQQGTMIDTPAIIAGRFGKGRVTLFSPHPEMTKGLEWLVRPYFPQVLRLILPGFRGPVNCRSRRAGGRAVARSCVARASVW